MGHYGCTAFLLSSGSFHHILNQTGQWPLTTALTLLLTFCNQFKSLVGARLYKARSRAFPNFRWTALDIWISTSEKMNQLLHYFFAICLKKKARHCPSKEVHPWKTPMSPCRMLMSSKCKVKPLNRSLLSGGRISMIMINWSYLLSSLSIVFLFRGACRQNGGVGEQTFAIFDSSLQSWGCLQNWHNDQQFDLFCIFYILLRLIRWDHYQILVHIYHRGHVDSQLLARHLWDW